MLQLEKAHVPQWAARVATTEIQFSHNQEMHKSLSSDTFCCSVAQSCLTLRLHGLRHTGLHCPSPSPRACSNWHPLSQWMPSNHLVICCRPYPTVFSLSQLRGLFQWVISPHHKSIIIIKIMHLSITYWNFLTMHLCNSSLPSNHFLMPRQPTFCFLSL